MKPIAVGIAIFVLGCAKQDDPAAPRGETVPIAEREAQPPGGPQANSLPAADVAPAEGERPRVAQTPPAADDNDRPSDVIEALSEEQQEQLLAARLDGGMDGSFGRFANMFLVFSRIQLGNGVGLMTSSEEIAEAPLASPFPSTYRPTLREFLDAIALQTFSKWKYDPSNKYLKSELEQSAPASGLAIFEFTPAKREKPFEVDLAAGWSSVDKGNWTMYIPPVFPVGMDIYEMGRYSAEGDAPDPEFFDGVRRDVALEWAQRVKEDAAEADLTPAKIGAYDALFFEARIPSQLEKEIRWRHWVLMEGDQCFFIVSTIVPELEDEIFPDVEKMLASFRVKDRPRTP